MKPLHTAQPLVEELERAAQRARLALDAAVACDHNLLTTARELEDRRDAFQEAALDAQHHANSLALWCQPGVAPRVARCDKVVWAGTSSVRVCDAEVNEYGDCPDAEAHVDASVNR